jgi:uncharacterized protein YndB with AHSA1/START domain
MTTALVMIDKVQVQLQGDTDVIVKRDFKAPPGHVWRALTTPDLMKQWMLAHDWQMTVCEIDLREGGSFEWRWTGPDGSSMGFSGPYLKVEPHRRIVHREMFNGDPSSGCDVTTIFEAVPHGTRLTITISYASAEAREAALATGMTDGMEVTYRNLDGLLPGWSASGDAD